MDEMTNAAWLLDDFVPEACAHTDTVP